jgi:hypothetical protein
MDLFEDDLTSHPLFRPHPSKAMGARLTSIGDSSKLDLSFLSI